MKEKNKNIQNRNLDIQLTRILAMVFIVLCHLVQQIHIPIVAKLSQFLNVGVYIFFFISGYLYGDKEIKDKKSWFRQRFIILMIPIYIFLIFIFVVQYMYGVFQVKYVFIYGLNLQRFFGYSLWLEHLWFMTVIWICYFITPVLYKNQKLLTPTFIICFWMVCSLVSYGNKNIGQILFYISAYLVGYIYKKESYKTVNNSYLFLGVAICIFVRLLGLYFLDNTIFYDNIIVFISQIILSIFIYCIIKNYVKCNFIIKIRNVMNHFDELSFYIYITHCTFISGPIRMIQLTPYLFINIVIILIAIYISALLLQILSTQLRERIIK